MSAVRGAPPGRAGRTWLARRLETARRGAGLLDRKLRILRREQERFALRAQEATERWSQVLDDAETWALRAALLGGEGALRPGPRAGIASVTVSWAAVMGARFPDDARLDLGEEADGGRGPVAASAAVACAREAYRTALEAAVEAAVALAAARVVDDELATTRLRLRAVEDRWIPRLERAAEDLELALAEAESAQAVRLRIAGRRAAAALPRPSPAAGPSSEVAP